MLVIADWLTELTGTEVEHAWTKHNRGLVTAFFRADGAGIRVSAKSARGGGWVVVAKHSGGDRGEIGRVERVGSIRV
jgi:hypothetical protein